VITSPIEKPAGQNVVKGGEGDNAGVVKGAAKGAAKAEGLIER
jgi:hypothetical protein